MKKITYSLATAVALLTASTAMAQQGFGTNNPDKSAAVHIESKNKGLLIPRVALTNETTPLKPTVKQTEGLMVFNTKADANGTGLKVGFYYWTVTGATTGTTNSSTTGKWMPIASDREGKVNIDWSKVPDGSINGSKIIDNTIIYSKIKDGTIKGEKIADNVAEGKGAVEWSNMTPPNGTATDRYLKVVAKNGVQLIDDGNNSTKKAVGLGGELTKATKITTTANNTLSIAGLQPADFKENKGKDLKTVVVDNDGKLQTVNTNGVGDDGIVGGDTPANGTPGVGGSEIVLGWEHETVLLSNTAGQYKTAKLPKATEFKGKKYYIKNVNPDGTDSDGIKVTTTAANGDIFGQPTGDNDKVLGNNGQGIIIQSNGTKWYVIGISN